MVQNVLPSSRVVVTVTRTGRNDGVMRTALPPKSSIQPTHQGASLMVCQDPMFG